MERKGWEAKKWKSGEAEGKANRKELVKKRKKVEVVNEKEER